jgi:hypothetical protein
MNSRKPWLLSVSGPLRLAWALPNNPKRIVFSSGENHFYPILSRAAANKVI